MSSLLTNIKPPVQFYPKFLNSVDDFDWFQKSKQLAWTRSEINMYTINLAYELRDTPVKVNAVDPGFVATDFNNHRGTGTVEEAGARIAKYAIIDSDSPTGKFFSEEYNPETGEIPW